MYDVQWTCCIDAEQITCDTQLSQYERAQTTRRVRVDAVKFVVDTTTRGVTWRMKINLTAVTVRRVVVELEVLPPVDTRLVAGAGWR